MSKLLDAIQKNRESILKDWLKGMNASLRRRDLIADGELETQASDVLSTIADAPAEAVLEDFSAPAWQPLRDLLSSLSASRATRGFTPSETAIFVLSLKPPLFALSRRQWGANADELFTEISIANDFVDKLALHTTDSYIHGRDQVIARQQEEMLELSTRIVDEKQQLSIVLYFQHSGSESGHKAIDARVGRA